MKKLDLYAQLSRPFTLLPPLLGIISGSVCAWGSVHNPDPSRTLTLSVVLTVALGSLCASFLNAASNAINQITDLDIDRVNKPGRPLVTGALSCARRGSSPGSSTRWRSCRPGPWSSTRT